MNANNNRISPLEKVIDARYALISENKNTAKNLCELSKALSALPCQKEYGIHGSNAILDSFKQGFKEPGQRTVLLNALQTLVNFDSLTERGKANELLESFKLCHEELGCQKRCLAHPTCPHRPQKKVHPGAPTNQHTNQ